MNTSTKNHDFFSVKGDGYVVSMNVESIEDEDFIFEQEEIYYENIISKTW